MDCGETVVGVIYKTAGTRQFTAALSREDVKRGDYIEVVHPQDGPVLCQITEVEEVSSLSYDQAQSIRLGGDVKHSKKLSGHVDVIGYRDEGGLVRTPRTPFSPGTSIIIATDELIIDVLGLGTGHENGAYIGMLEGHDIKVELDINALVQKHMSIIAKTGSGKSYLVGVLLEEFIQKRIPAVVIDPHGEYTSLIYPNNDAEELPNMKRFDIKAKGFGKHVMEYTCNLEDNPLANELKLDGLALEPDDIFDLTGMKQTGAMAGLVFRSIDGLQNLNAYYSIDDIIFSLEKNKNPMKWNLINNLEHIKSLGIFANKPTPLKSLVKPGQVSIINLKGAGEDVSGVYVTQIIKKLFKARKANQIPPMMLFIEEAHNYCPQQGHALSNKVIRTIASEGRKFGMGLCIVTQRPAKVDKNVLSQCNTQVIFKITNPNDLKAITASLEGMTTSMQDDIQRLPVSHAYVVGGWITRPINTEVRVRMSKHGGKGADVFSTLDPEFDGSISEDPEFDTDDQQIDQFGIEEEDYDEYDH